MTLWLLDTNILSERRRPRPNPNVVKFVTTQPLDCLHVSIVTFAELRFGIDRLTETERDADLHEWLTLKVRPLFLGRVLAITEDVMVEEGRKSGHTFSQPDLIIVATAFYHGPTVVTRDVSDYGRANVPILNPWIDPLPTGQS